MTSFTILTLFIGLVAANASPLNGQEPVNDESGLPKLTGEKVTPADKLEFPYVVRITVTRDNETVICGGSIISASYVLTAAQCFYPISPPITRVRIEVGFTNLRNLTGGEYAIEIYGKPNVVIHENYTESTHMNDIALLQAPFLNTSSSKAIALAPKDFYVHENHWWVNIAGWGPTVYGGPLSSVLMKKAVPTAQNSWCPAWHEYFQASTQICVGSWTVTGVEYEDINVGDYGSPIVADGQQIGIASFNGGWNAAPSIYTRVSAFRDWINKNMK